MKKVLLFIFLGFLQFTNAQTPIQNFEFNNSLISSIGGTTLTGTNVSYQTDRNGIANNALSLSGSVTVTSYVNGIISNLPVGNSNRTFSFWAKADYVGVDPCTFFAYGTAANNQALGFDIWLSTQRRLIRYAWGAAATFDSPIDNTFAYANWNHYAMTYNGSSLKVYVNGVLLFTNALSSINTVGTDLNIGKSIANQNSTTFGFDDFQIYDVALNDAQISQLYVENNFNLGITAPAITSVSNGAINPNNATVNFSIHAKGAATSYLVRYGLSSTNLNNTYNGFSTTSLYQANPLSLVLPGLFPGTTYYYAIEATNSAGTTTSATYSFTTAGGSFTPVAEYLFNGTLSNTSGTEPFYTTGGISFANDRFGASNRAVYLNSGLPSAPITTLPYGTSSRTISIWIRPAQVNADNIIFTYGSGSGNSAYGASFSPSIMYNFSYSSNLAFTTPTSINVWKHMVYTYDIATNTAKIYIDGVLRNSGSFPSWNTQSGSSFYLGNLFGGAASAYVGAMDDLKIYDRAISASEVSLLFTNNTLSSADFNQNNLQVSLYPNPATDILNIEMTNEIKSIEIYNIQGQKVMSSNQKQINISDLAAGLYMVRIQDVDNAIATKKIIIE